MRVQLDRGSSILRGEVVYRAEELSWDYVVRACGRPQGGRALQIGTVQIELDETGRLLYVWGFHPFQNWRSSALVSPVAAPALVRVDVAGLGPGASVAMWPDADVETVIDRRAGWVRMGQRATVPGECFLEFAEGCVLELRAADMEVVALWLRSRGLPAPP